ncbi:MAG: hypothetical protein IPL42_09990 [Saprospiraceae bacterium]|nr:hypothetical protein [Saprospiraceae bacterium]
MYFKSILVFTAIIFWNNLLNSQITKVDSQWYVLNYEGRSFGSVGTTGQYPYLNQMVDGNSVVKIIGTSTPSTYLHA